MHSSNYRTNPSGLLLAPIQSASVIMACTAPFFLCNSGRCSAKDLPPAEVVFSAEEYRDLQSRFGGVWGGEDGAFIPPGELFPDGRQAPGMTKRTDIGWYTLQYFDNDASGLVPNIKPGMLKSIADDRRVTGVKIDGLVGFVTDGPARIDFGEAVIRDLPLLDHVKCLYLRYVDLRDPRLVKYLNGMENLEWLNVNYCGVGLKSFFRNTGSFPKLETLIISPRGHSIFGEKKPPRGLDAIDSEDVFSFSQRVPRLRVMEIQQGIDTPMKKSVVHAFSNFKNLKHLAIAPVEGRDYRKHTDEHNKYFFRVIAPLKKSLPGCKIEMSALELDLAGTGLPSLDR